ncbi:MAG: hypothetical protein RLZZ182_559 [Pseudomonadota bacterium]
MSTDSQRLAIAAHLHVAMRRKMGRVTDTEWMASNVEYAMAMTRLCRAEQDADLTALADRLDAAFEPLRPRRAKVGEAANEVPSRWHDSELRAEPRTDSQARSAELSRRYVGRLR